MKFDIITIFPHIFDCYFNESIIKRAQERGLVKINVHNLRDFSSDRHKSVDDKPYGGGAGMLLMAGPLIKAVGSIRRGKKEKTKIAVFSAKGRQFDQKTAYEWAKKYDRVIFVSGRYEGIDERVKTILKADEISIGPYVLIDGDVAVMAVVSAVARLVPGVIKEESLAEESFGSPKYKKDNWKLEIRNWKFCKEYPHYTRPEVIRYKGKKYAVPKVLLSGDHRKIGEWRRAKMGA